MKDATLCFVVRGDPAQQILLGMKKLGFGAGKYDGFGGKIEEAETVAAAAARELEEESGVHACPEHLQYVAYLDFVFPARPAWSQVVHAFIATRWTGTPGESAEMKPEWFALDAIPYAQMWDDSSYWLARILQGKQVCAHFTFKADNETVGHVEMQPLAENASPEVAAQMASRMASRGPGHDMMERLQAINTGLHRRFRRGNEPFQMMTRLLEECGELAQQVNHFEGSGVKREKWGAPDRAKLAKEVQDVLRCALQIAQHYGVEPELRASIDNSYQRLIAEGYIEDGGY